MKFKEYLNEKLQPSQFRAIVKKWKESGIARRYDSVFGKKDRLYEPYKGKLEKDTTINATKTEIENIFRNAPAHDYIIVDYNKGLAKNRDTGREIKIFKALTTLVNFYKEKLETVKQNAYFRRNYEEEIERVENAMKAFVNDKTRALQKRDEGYLICYSRHAYDIAGMSTDRGWTSCQNLEDGSMNHYVQLDIKAGTIIAYLIRENDKNIQRPVARALLKPFFNDNKQHILIAPCISYGVESESFVKQVQEWADKNFNKGKWGDFRIHPDVYPDDDIERVFKDVRPEDVPELRKKYKYVIVTVKDMLNYLAISPEHADRLSSHLGGEIGEDTWYQPEWVLYDLKSKDLVDIWLKLPLQTAKKKSRFFTWVLAYGYDEWDDETKGTYKFFKGFVDTFGDSDKIKDYDTFVRYMDDQKWQKMHFITTKDYPRLWKIWEKVTK